MSNTNNKDKLEEMRRHLAGNLDFTGTPGSAYEYSTAYAGPKHSQVLGTWKVTEHRVGDQDWVELFCANALKNTEVENMNYDATYEFSSGICVKKVLVSGELVLEEGRSIYEYRMNVALSWELKSGTIRALPVLGYQYSSVDGQPAAVRDLPSANEWISLALRFEDDCLILEDGDDYKKLERLEK